MKYGMGLCKIAALAWLLWPVQASALDVINLRGEQAQQVLARLQEQLENEPGNTSVRRDAGILLHQIARERPDRETVEQSEAYLKQVTESQPGDHEAKAWLGSVITMKAMFVSDPGKQTFYVKLGSRKMDKAVAAAPDNLVIRLIRATNSLELPAFLKRTRYAVTDLEYYLQACEQADCGQSEVKKAQSGLAKAKAIIGETS